MNIRDELKWLIPIAAVSFLVFANTIGGDFVYDDHRQLLRNPLIQDNSLIWNALTSDVWAFKGDGSISASNYWRPTFTAWSILNFRLFGADPVGWHVTSILLHTAICLLIFGLLRKWEFSSIVAFSIAIIFAVHPVHVESVAWISGSPDLLFAIAFLGSLWFATSYRGTRSKKDLVLTAVLYAVALGAKEIGIICLPVFYFVLKDFEGKKKKQTDHLPLIILAGVAAAYFLIRWQIIGTIAHSPDDPIDLAAAIRSIPQMFTFYIRQILFPFQIGANYSFVPVYELEVMAFLVPLAISGAVLAAIYFVARASRVGWIAASIFLLPLIPAMNASAFGAEQLVHDRYLYLPLLGALMLIFLFAMRYVSERNLLIGAVVWGGLLSIQTVRYNAAWTTDLAIWQWTSAMDDSAFTSIHYGSSLTEAERTSEAITAYSAAIQKRPTARALIGRARNLVLERRYSEAEADLTKALQTPRELAEAYTMYQAFEALSIVYSEQRKFQDAVGLLTRARNELPIYSAALSEKLAVVLYQSGQKEKALRELESAREKARVEMLPESKAVFLRLGMLYAELGRKDEARTALREYLRLTDKMSDMQTLEERDQAKKIIAGL